MGGTVDPLLFESGEVEALGCYAAAAVVVPVGGPILRGGG